MFKNFKDWLLCYSFAALAVISREIRYRKTGVYPELTLSINDTPVLRWKQGAKHQDFDRLA